MKLAEPARQRSGAGDKYIIMPTPAAQGQYAPGERAQPAFCAIPHDSTAKLTRCCKADPHGCGWRYALR